jgi:hypothetical protein
MKTNSAFADEDDINDIDEDVVEDETHHEGF